MKQNISVVRGRTQTFNISLTDADGNPYILSTDEKLIFGVKKNYFDENYVCSKQITSANEAETAGVYSFKLSPSDTDKLSCCEYCYDVGLQSGSDYFTVIECSHLKIEHNVTCKEATA